jgi:hypothetical protein
MAKQNFILPVQSNPAGYAKVTLKGAGLGLIKPKFFNIDKDNLEADTEFNPDVHDKKSWFGLPIYDVVSFGGVTYEDEIGETVAVLPGSKFTLDKVVLEVNQSRNIVKTELAGRNGTVKEYMSDGDYQISISGSFTEESNVIPYLQVQTLHKFCKAPFELKVESGFLNYLQIYSLVIEAYTIRPRQGFRNIVDYDLTCISETPFEIRNENEDKYKRTSFF